MKLYNLNTDKIENVTTILYTDVNYIVNKISITLLNTMGYYSIALVSPPDRRYYTYTEVRAVVANLYTNVYTPIERSLTDVQHRMANDLRDVYDGLRLRPRVDTGLGYDVFGGATDVEELAMWKDLAETTIIDADGEIQTVDGVAYITIADAIRSDRRSTFLTAKIKVAEVKALTTVTECILYEATPYQYTYTQEDVDNDTTGTIVLGGTVTRYTNNITEW